VAAGGCDESAPTAPVGEYAQSRLGGERLAEYQAAITSTPLCIVRLFYATECRYGVMHDLAQKVVADEPIPLHMGHVNQIWQRDANSMIIRCLGLARHPARTINISGTQTLSVRDLATRIGAMVGRPPRFEGVEADTALLGKCSAMEAELGQPRVSVAQMLAWVSAWVESGHKSLGKPTKFEARNGRF
jgi:nucleoside-diphosphate-sugar epimerase